MVSVHEFASAVYKQLFLNYDAHVQTVSSSVCLFVFCLFIRLVCPQVAFISALQHWRHRQANCEKSLLVFLRHTVCDSFSLQDVIVSLLTHAGSGSPSELQNSLTCVESLCLEHAASTASYGFMLQSLVDQVPRLSLGQARTLFRSLSSLAYVAGDSDSGLRVRRILIEGKR